MSRLNYVNSVMTNKVLFMFIDTGHMFTISGYNKAPIKGYIVLLKGYFIWFNDVFDKNLCDFYLK